MQKSAQKTGGQPRIDPSDRNSIALFSYGFRPFFLGSALWAIVALALWIGSLQGQFQLAPHYGALPWHGHEMLFGYGSGVVAGFLLTAAPNWTGRLPVAGVRLMALFSLWCVGRIALLATSVTGPLTAAVIDSLFLPCLLVVMGREILVGENWRNLMPLALMGIFAIANIDFHAEVLTTGASNYGLRAGVAALVGLIAVIGGRITPSYTHNWLSRAGSPVLPAPFGLFDKLALLTTCVALAAWIALPATTMTALLFLVAAGVLSVRLWRWRGTHTWQEPLLLVLHLGYAFVPLGFLLVAVPILAPNLLTGTAALHAWTVGAVGLMTLGVMSRATRGHTGHALNASPMTVASYGTMIVAALLRIAAGFFFQAYMMLVELAGAAWIIAFALFLVEYAPMLLRPRQARE
jgi:uncharacterized protein involved in response to NO